MLKFSIRELMLIVAILSVALGWVVRERQLRAELERAIAWRGRAGALESVIREDGRLVRYSTSVVFVERKLSDDPWDFSTVCIPTFSYQPSADPDK